MPERDIGQEILDGIREIKAHKMGQIGLRTTKLKNLPPKTIQDQPYCIDFYCYFVTIKVILPPNSARAFSGLSCDRWVGGFKA